MTAATQPSEKDQTVTLARTFLARFFDNDITGGSTDLRHTFLRLLAVLALPGIFTPHGKLAVWTRISLLEGGEVLRMQSAVDKVFALGTTMVIVTGLAAIVWQSLFIDRRDVLVLGSFPVRHRTILAGKFGALAVFFGIVTIAMHAISAGFYGMYLGTLTGLFFGLWMIVVHVLVSSAAGLFMYLTVIAAQGLLLGVAGPRQFARLAPALQLVIIASGILLFVMLPMTAAAAPGFIYDRPARAMPADVFWWMPPVWFLGLYETIQGTSNPTLHALAGRALLALGAVGALALVSYPLAYGRVVTDALVGTPVPARRGVIRRLGALVPVLLARSRVAQATLQFAIATIGRTSLHRLVIAVAVGAAAAFIVPVVAANVGTPLPRPTPGLLSVPILAMLFLLVSLRLSLGLPAELAGSWIFDATAGATSRWHRIAARRLLWVTGVTPPVLVIFVVFSFAWNVTTAWQHALVTTAIGVLVVELLLLGFQGVPCAKPYTPGGAKLQSRWPWYLFLLVILNIYIPQGEAQLLGTPYGVPILAATIFAAALAVRLWSDRRQRLGVDDIVDAELTTIPWGLGD